MTMAVKDEIYHIRCIFVKELKEEGQRAYQDFMQFFCLFISF